MPGSDVQIITYPTQVDILLTRSLFVSKGCGGALVDKYRTDDRLIWCTVFPCVLWGPWLCNW